MMHCNTCHPLAGGTYMQDSYTFSVRYRPPYLLLKVFSFIGWVESSTSEFRLHPGCQGDGDLGGDAGVVFE